MTLQSRCVEPGTLKTGEVGVRIKTTFGVDRPGDRYGARAGDGGQFSQVRDGGFYNGGRFHRATRPDNYTPHRRTGRRWKSFRAASIRSARERFRRFRSSARVSQDSSTSRGTVSMARGTAADTATSDFFILLDDQPSLDFGGKRFDDGQGGAAFGRVISGIDVVRQDSAAASEGQSLTPPVPIVGDR